MSNRIYIYALIAGPEQQELLDCVEINGKSEPVFGVWYNDIGFAVSIAEEFNQETLTEEMALNWYIKHLKVIETLSKTFTTVTAKIGTILENVATAREILEKTTGSLKTIVNDMKDKTEFDLIISWRDLKKVMAAAGEEPDIKGFKEQLVKQPQITPAEIQKIGEMMGAALARRKREVQELVIQELGARSEKFTILAATGDQIAVNAAFLTTLDQGRAIKRKLNAVVGILENGYGINQFEVRFIGPLPPKNFAAMELKLITADDLAAAKAILGVDSASPELAELRLARNGLLQSYHPDKNAESVIQPERARALIGAYRLIDEYCNNFGFSRLPENPPDAYVVKVVQAQSNQD